MFADTPYEQMRALVYERGSPFIRLADKLAPEPAGATPINLTVGEPRHPVPGFVGPILAEHIGEFNRYPPITGTAEYRAAAGAWLERRYKLGGKLDPERTILPLNGSREGLFFAALVAKEHIPVPSGRPVVLLPNPFYQVYAAGALAAGAEPVYLDSVAETNFLPDLDAIDPDILNRAIALYYASPTNPQGTVADEAIWDAIIVAARRHNFMVFADECYSEIYRSDPPPGILTTAAKSGSFDNVAAFHSLSKRSNLAGLRCGFVAGDPAFIALSQRLRNMAAPQVPLPIQAVGAKAWSDETHVAENRTLYNAKFASAENILEGRFGFKVPAAGFFLWLEVSQHGGGEIAALRLWREVGVRVIPGAYLCEPGRDGRNPGESFIRIAMVADQETTSEALARLVSVLDKTD